MTATVQQALSELLDALGFTAMAHDVQTETDRARLATYARIVLKQTADPAQRQALKTRFLLLRLI